MSDNDTSRPETSDELSDDALEAVAGGGDDDAKELANDIGNAIGHAASWVSGFWHGLTS